MRDFDKVTFGELQSLDYDGLIKFIRSFDIKELAKIMSTLWMSGHLKMEKSYHGPEKNYEFEFKDRFIYYDVDENKIFSDKEISENVWKLKTNKKDKLHQFYKKIIYEFTDEEIDKYKLRRPSSLEFQQYEKGGFFINHVYVDHYKDDIPFFNSSFIYRSDPFYSSDKYDSQFIKFVISLLEELVENKLMEEKQPLNKGEK